MEIEENIKQIKTDISSLKNRKSSTFFEVFTVGFFLYAFAYLNKINRKLERNYTKIEEIEEIEQRQNQKHYSFEEKIDRFYRNINQQLKAYQKQNSKVEGQREK